MPRPGPRPPADLAWVSIAQPTPTTEAPPPTPQPEARPLSVLLGLGALLPGALFSVVAALILIFGATHTSRLFAWTSGSGAAAATLGAGFAAAAVMFELSGLAQRWDRARLGVIAMLTGAPLLLLASALDHSQLAGIDASATRSAPTATAAATIWWVALLALTGIAALGIRAQVRATGEIDTGRLPATARTAGTGAGGFIAAVGLVGFLAPGTGARWLPFATAPLDVRAIAAVQLAIGVTLAVAAWTTSSASQGAALAGLGTYLGVEVLVLLLQSRDLHWRAGAVVFVAYLLVLSGALAIGTSLYLADRRLPRRPEPQQP